MAERRWSSLATTACLVGSWKRCQLESEKSCRAGSLWGSEPTTAHGAFFRISTTTFNTLTHTSNNMKTFHLALLMLTFVHCSNAQINNPVTHFMSLGPGVQPVIKWVADIDGDGKSEVFLSLKDEYDQDVASDQAPGWFVYIADAASTNYSRSTGIKDQGDDSVGAAVPMIDLKLCFVGMVDELGKQPITSIAALFQATELTPTTTATPLAKLSKKSPVAGTVGSTPMTVI